MVLLLWDVFFFSSRRRHTRWTGDWSSDVCSSDLTGELRRNGHRAAVIGAVQQEARHDRRVARDEARPQPRDARALGRSEERRVGKECRSRWSPDHEKKNKMQ